MLSVSRAADQFIATLRARQAPINTVRSYASDLRRFALGAPDDLAAVDGAAVRSFLESPDGQSPATRRRWDATLRTFYRWALREGVVTMNPMERVDPQDDQPRAPSAGWRQRDSGAEEHPAERHA